MDSFQWYEGGGIVRLGDITDFQQVTVAAAVLIGVGPEGQQQVAEAFVKLWHGGHNVAKSDFQCLGTAVGDAGHWLYVWEGVTVVEARAR